MSRHLDYNPVTTTISRMTIIPEETVFTGPSMMDKALVGCVWFVGLVYSLLTEQILSKEVDIPCSVR